jgi:hypothetical protein
LLGRTAAQAGIIWIAILLLQTLGGMARAEGLAGTHGSAAAGRPLDEVHAAIERSARYLTQAVGADGQFLYRVNPEGMNPRPVDYNVLRHAGAIYALATYYRHWRADVQSRPALLRAGRFLQTCCLGALPARPDMLGVWSPPTLTGDDRLQVKLGGNGLGLVALMNLEAIAPGFTSLEELRGLGRFIVYMQKTDGGFFSRYDPQRGGRRDRWVSVYYPGEAALGLLLLYEHDPSPVWLRSAIKALEYLAHSRANQSSVPADHWALLATARLLRADTQGKPGYATWHNPPSEPLREFLIGHAAQIAESILDTQIERADDPVLAGGFASDGRTAPTATCLEGLLAALSILPREYATLRERIKHAVHAGMAFLLRAQIRSGPQAGGMPRAVRSMAPGQDSQRDYRRAGEIRIDYVQHALSALLQYVEHYQCQPGYPLRERHPRKHCPTARFVIEAADGRPKQR